MIFVLSAAEADLQWKIWPRADTKITIDIP
jgi:hypothetical protein